MNRQRFVLRLSWRAYRSCKGHRGRIAAVCPAAMGSIQKGASVDMAYRHPYQLTIIRHDGMFNAEVAEGESVARGEWLAAFLST